MRIAAAPFARATVRAYDDLIHVVYALRPLVLIAFAINIVEPLLELLLVGSFGGMLRVAGREIILALHVLLLTPVLVAIHRLVVLGEADGRYSLTLANPRTQLFFGWAFILTLAARIPRYLVAATVSTAPVYYTGPRPPLAPYADPFVVLIAAVMAVAIFVFALRISILFPAIASDAREVTWQNALKDTRGHTWYILFMIFIPMLPFGAMAWMIMKLAETVLPWQAALAVHLVAIGALSTIVSILAAAVASRLFVLFGVDLEQPAAR